MGSGLGVHNNLFCTQSSTYSETASKLSTQYHYILDCVQKRSLCTPSPLYVVTDTGATWLVGKPPFSWLESVQSEMRLAPYYFIILIFNSRKGREGMKTFGDFQKNGKSPLSPPVTLLHPPLISIPS